MIHIYRNIDNRVLFTLSSETGTLQTDFDFTFTNQLTNDVVEWSGSNQSTVLRYDEVTIPGSVFDGYDGGLWIFSVGTCQGYMNLHNEDFTPTVYSGQDNIYVTYGS